MSLVRALAALQRGLALRVSPRMQEEHGLDLRLFVLMKRIAGGAAHPGELARFSLEQPSQISRQLDKLESLGLIERTLDREDSRRIRLALTAPAARLLDSIDEAFVELIGPAFSTIHAAERKAMITGLQTLSAALQPKAEDPR